MKEKSTMEIWAENEVAIACKREAPDRKEGEFDYGCACHESAMKAFRSLLEDGHSGASITFTKDILNRLISGKPLTPIEDTDDIWTEVDLGFGDKRKDYQCKRMSSLFKRVYPDGKVKYNDINRFVGVYMNGEGGWHSGLIDMVLDEMYPITMPYCPTEKPYLVYTQEYLTDRKNGDFDTVGIRFVTPPGGTKILVNRFFKEEPYGFVEIGEEEFAARKELHEARKREEEAANNA